MQKFYSYEVEKIVQLPNITGSAVRARRCEKCDKIWFVNVGVDEESLNYICPNCRTIENKPIDPNTAGLSQS